MAATRTLTDSLLATTGSAANWSVTINTGTAAAGRDVLVAVSWEGIITLSSATIDGNAAGIFQGSGSDQGRMAFVALRVPTGTSSTLALTFSGSVTAGAPLINAVYRLITADVTVAADTAEDLTASLNPSASIDVPAGGLCFAMTRGNGNNTRSWTNLTEDTDGTNGRSAASAEFASAQTGLAVSVTSSGSIRVFAVSFDEGGTDVQADVTGVQGTTAVGTVSVGAGVTASVTGVEATASVGSVTVTTVQSPIVAVTGVQATASVGSVSVTAIADGEAAVSGVFATAMVGEVSVTAIDTRPTLPDADFVFGGGAPIAPFIKWGRKKKKEQPLEVVEMVQEIPVEFVTPQAPIDLSPVIAQFQALMQQHREMQERERAIEQDDEDVLLMM